MTLQEIKNLKNYGYFPLKGLAHKKFQNDLESTYKGMLGYLGLSNAGGSMCHLKGLMLCKEEKVNVTIGTELQGTWFSGAPATEVVTI